LKNILICTTKSWNIKHTKILGNKLNNYNINLITERHSLILENIKEIAPDIIFFPHWSWIIPKTIHENFNCIGFHLTDLPYGKGGSPLQNLILRKKYFTKISAFQITEQLDGGDIYLKKDFFVGSGNADEIFIRASEIIFFDMIPEIIYANKKPYKQKGESVVFTRRKPEESNMTDIEFKTLCELYDFIRMLDGEDYPKAFIKTGKYKIKFSNATLRTNKLEGFFEVTEDE
jgi:methionyl-tRNA formyltransferase